MEDESRVFGQGTENLEDDNLKNIKNSDSDHSDKENISKTDADKAIGDFLAYVDELIENEPEPSEEEVRSGIDKILAKAYPEEKENTPAVSVEKGRKKKVAVKKVLLFVALFAALSFYAVGNYHNISTENGFVTYAKDTIQITFFGESKEEYISVDTLLADLKAHGYKDIMFPEAFLFDLDCRASVPQYSVVNEVEQAAFAVYYGEKRYSFCINKNDATQTTKFPVLDNAQTVIVEDIHIYVFEYDTGISGIEFIENECHYFISSYIPYTEMISIAETIK